MKKLLLFCLIINFQILLINSAGSQQSYFKMPANATTKDYLPNTIIFKIKQDYRDKCNKNLINIKEIQIILNELGINKLAKKFNNNNINNKLKNSKINNPGTSIDLIYETEYSNNFSIEQAINKLYSTGKITYAVPHYLPYPAYVPNDPFYSQQYYINLSGIQQAWDLIKGDSNIVVGLVDTGIELNHPDLINNIKYNYKDIIDGIDNDNDGFIDNYYGWDLAGNNNNPLAKSSFHGIHSAGIIAATANNGTGIAGIGNKCKILPVKIDNAAGYLTMAYEGIVYAADNNCSVINCAWYSKFSPGQYGQDIIDYATNNCNALIVAAAGNDNSENITWPAAYNNVLSVGAINKANTKLDVSNYGNYIDIVSYGADIFSTWSGGTYLNASGTSPATAIVSGCAALLRSYYPNLNPLQITELLKVNSDTIYNLPANQNYYHKLGAGKINLYKALTDSVKPSVIVSEYSFSDNNDNIFLPEETVYLKCNFLNYLKPSKKLKITLKSKSSYIDLIDTVFIAGVINTLQKINNNSQAFRFKITDSIPINYNLELKIIFEDSLYSAFQILVLPALNRNYIDINVNKISTTFTSKGRIGFNTENMSQGQGFLFENNPVLACGGLIIGNATNKIIDCVYGTGTAWNDMFRPIINAKSLDNPKYSDFEALTVFDDKNAGAYRLGVKITNKAFAYKNSEDANYIIYEYIIKNDSNYTIKDFYAGLFADWNINFMYYNKVLYNNSNKLAYAFNSDSSLYVAIKGLSVNTFKQYAIDNNGSNNSIKIDDGFTTNEKYQTLIGSRNAAGTATNGNNIAQVLSAGPFTIKAKDSISVVFAIVAGNNLNEINKGAERASAKYSLMQNVENIKNDNFFVYCSPNPFYNNLNFFINCREKQNINLNLFNIKGQKIKSLLKNQTIQGIYNLNIPVNKLENGIYFYKLETANQIITGKLIKIK